jgi:hypothetical protein
MPCAHCGHTLHDHVSIDRCQMCSVEVHIFALIEALRGYHAATQSGMAEYICGDYDH